MFSEILRVRIDETIFLTGFQCSKEYMYLFVAKVFPKYIHNWLTHSIQAIAFYSNIMLLYCSKVIFSGNKNKNK